MKTINHEEVPPVSEDALEIARMTKELRESARKLSRRDGRYLMDARRQIQQARIRANNQIRADEMEDDAALPVLESIAGYLEALEARIELIMKHFAGSYVVGKWCLDYVTGIGGVWAAELLAHIDITKADTAGDIWSFAGLNPKQKWWNKSEARKLASNVMKNKLATDQELVVIADHLDIEPEVLGKRLKTVANKENPRPTRPHVIKAITMRPWNADLKTLCWKIGKSFVKHKNSSGNFYWGEYAKRKVYEQRKNKAGDYANQAADKLKECPDHEQADIYAEGSLPNGHIDRRARRWTEKLFLSHWQWIAYKAYYGEDPPKPYIIEHGPHTHVIKPPHYDDVFPDG